jgi:activator of 2-hydroxyglutaryl-CoA dehydratase
VGVISSLPGQAVRTVFAESDMIHKQQMGHSIPDIVAGLCEALVRNYLNNVGKGKDGSAASRCQG